MKKIITIQHTQSIHHTNGMVGSWTDWDLSVLGIEQAHNIGKKLSKEIKGEEYILYTSDLKRSKHTADIVSAYLNVTPIIRTELRERNLGSAVGKSVSWIEENAVPYKHNIDHRCLDDAETVREHWDRLLIFYNEIINSRYENIVIISHGGTLSLFCAMWLKIDIENLNFFTIHGKAGGISRFYENNLGIRIAKSIGDMSYILKCD